MIRYLVAALLGCAVFGHAALAEESCSVTGALMSKDAIKQSLEQRGYTKIRSLSTHNGCYEAKGFDAKGHRFELELNGSTGQIVNAE